MALIHFLLVYDHAAGHLRSQQEFRNANQAAAAYADLEQVNRGDRDLEIVLVGADSLETIKQTHANYFQDVSEPVSLSTAVG